MTQIVDFKRQITKGRKFLRGAFELKKPDNNALVEKFNKKV